MNSMLSTLLNVLTIATTLQKSQKLLQVIPINDIIAELVSGMHSDQIRNNITIIIQEIAADPATFESGVIKVIDICREIHEQHNNTININKSFTSRHIDELLGFALSLTAESIEHIIFAPKSIQPFTLIQSLTIAPTSDNFETILISEVPDNGEDTITKSDSHALLKKIDIIYNKASKYPKMNIRIPSANQDAALQNARMNWTQRDTPEDDLDIYNYDQKKLGTIITRSASLPYEIHGSKVSVRIPNADNAELLITNILNRKDEVLSRYIKLNISRGEDD